MNRFVGCPLFLFIGIVFMPLHADEAASAPLTQFLNKVLGQNAAAPPLSGPVELVSAHQDFKHITFDLSCHTLTPIQIGPDKFNKGLGMHANGNAVFKLNRPFVKFVAHVGIDNNADTAGNKGTAAFAVKVDGKQVAGTPVCKGGQAGVPVEVPLTNAKQLELIVTDGGDGIFYDQADWGDAALIDADGHKIFLSDAVDLTQIASAGQGLNGGFLQQSTLPASFVYGGVSSTTLLASWSKESKPPVAESDRTIYETTWREPGGGLVVTWRAEVFHDSPAMEFRWTFTNEGSAPTKTITQVYALDLTAGLAGRPFKVLHSAGGTPVNNMDDPYLGFALSESPGGVTNLSAGGGRSSSHDLPFFLVHAQGPDEGIFVGIGWSGQWQAQIDGSKLPAGVRITAEMPDMNLALPPGEKIISPSILLGTYKGEMSNGSNTLRRLLYDKYMPLLNGEKPMPPVSWNSWFTFQNMISEDLLEKQADGAAKAGIEYFCIDAGWFEGGFPDGVGNWTVDKAKFPQGLAAIGNYVTKKGMHLGLWFEPERVGDNTRLVHEHPEWLHGNLVDFGNKDAREWVFQMMKGFIDEGHVRWIRWDFNTSPLPNWDGADAADQHGLHQIQHIMGLYELLDRLMKAYPDLLIEGCASGGQRIDLETIKRSHTFWKSDETGSLPVMRFHETSGNTFLPGVLLNTNLLPDKVPFEIQSIFGGALGLRCDWTKLDPTSFDRITKEIALYKKLRPLLDADYYPLFTPDRSLTSWVGWQFDDPSKGEGFIVVLRPPDSPYISADIALRGLSNGAKYTLTPLDETPGDSRELTGARFAQPWTVELKPATTGAIYKYSKSK
jgi:alpha-galactosidase